MKDVHRHDSTTDVLGMQICGIAEDLLKTEYDALRIVYNQFGSAVSYRPTIATVLSPDVSRLHSSPVCTDLHACMAPII